MERSIHDLNLPDFDAHPIWDTRQFDVGGGIDSTVEPLVDQNVLHGSERFPWVRARGRLADGTVVAAIVGVSFNPPQLLVPTLYIEGREHTFSLPPAPDFVLAQEGPKPLSEKLGRSVAAVFPFTLTSEVIFGPTRAPISTTFSIEGASVA